MLVMLFNVGVAGRSKFQTSRVYVMVSPPPDQDTSIVPVYRPAAVLGGTNTSTQMARTSPAPTLNEVKAEREAPMTSSTSGTSGSGNRVCMASPFAFRSMVLSTDDPTYFPLHPPGLFGSGFVHFGGSTTMSSRKRRVVG